MLNPTVSKKLIRLKQGVWLYFLFLLFEGALRKWFLPGLATPLLVVRDPIAIWLIFRSIQLGLFPFNVYSFCMSVIALVSFFATLHFGHGNIYVAAYGLRIFLLHFPLIFIIARIFDRQDVIQVGKFVVWLTIPMTILIALQFYSPQSAWVNLGVGGDTEGAGFGGALGYFRPPGTFSFTNGTAAFYGLAAPFIFYFWLHRYKLNKLVLVAATAGLLAAIPLSISRTLFFSVCLTLLFLGIASLYKPKYLGSMIISVFGGALVLAALSNAPFFQTATEAFTVRFESANKTEGGMEGVLGNRYLGSMGRALSYRHGGYPFFGKGLGMGTNVGAMLLSGEKEFLVAEEEWPRIIGEMGPLLGVLTLLVRMLVSLFISISAFKKLSFGDMLPWLLLSFALINLPLGQWAQPTNLGFAIVSGALVLASVRGTHKT
ncbi:MAG: hypothetical protein EOO10_03855 [Chitinophagaceae bacterium]|nr:MAG: hypothetical protein EOO10_03855 [Chitinophagaceae bacterium]